MPVRVRSLIFPRRSVSDSNCYVLVLAPDCLPACLPDRLTASLSSCVLACFPACLPLASSSFFYGGSADETTHPPPVLMPLASLFTLQYADLFLSFVPQPLHVPPSRPVRTTHKFRTPALHRRARYLEMLVDRVSSP